MPNNPSKDPNDKHLAKRHLNFKMMRAIVIMSTVIAAVAVIFGYTLYYNAIRRDFKNKSYELAETASAMVPKLNLIRYSERVLDIYDELPEDLILRQESEEYKSQFNGIEDYGYSAIEKQYSILQDYNKAKSVYAAAIDIENKRLIYIVDSDDSENHCFPGTWEELNNEEMNIYLGNYIISALERFYGFDASGEAYIYEDPKYGYLCTAGLPVYNYKGYAIGTFTDLDMTKAQSISFTFLWQYTLILVILIVIIAVFTSRYIRKTVVKPLNKLAKAAISYVNDKKDNVDTEGHFANLNINTGDEIQNLGMVMDEMESDLNSYIYDMTLVAAEKERFYTELDVAKRIQEGSVPHVYPPFPDRKEFDVYASMTTAREVGGDFYDFFMPDDDHLILVMADVSGKGIPAALFMMASKILIKNDAKIMKASPAEILNKFNNDTCRNNTEDMFVSVWLGILEISSGRITAANAGHEYPAVMKNGGNFELLKDRHGLVVGSIEDVQYYNYTIDLEPGDRLFLYTDGVAEATDPENRLFGTGRMIESLNKNKDSSIKDMLSALKADIDEFVRGAPQFDDISMMCLKYNTSKKE